jgi:hypothetical protein
VRMISNLAEAPLNSGLSQVIRHHQLPLPTLSIPIVDSLEPVDPRAASLPRDRAKRQAGLFTIFQGVLLSSRQPQELAPGSGTSV